MLKKFCPKCSVEKDSTDFNKDPRGKLGLSGYCKQCYTKYKSEKRKERSRHYTSPVCSNCGRSRLSTSKFCLRCLVSSSINRGKVDKDKRQALIDGLIRKLENSEYSCFYTGLPLVPGLNLSLDHRIPLSKGGTNDLSNLEWIHTGINFLKNDRTEKEFIAAYGSMLVEYNLLASKGII